MGAAPPEPRRVIKARFERKQAGGINAFLLLVPPPHLASPTVGFCEHQDPAEWTQPSFLLFFPLHPGRGSQDARKTHKNCNICSFFPLPLFLEGTYSLTQASGLS